MAENVYEGMFIFDANRFARDQAALPSQIEQLVQSLGGTMLASRMWEERRLAYTIKGHRKGTYWLTYFRADGDSVVGMNRQLQINDSVLRHLILKIDPRLADALVAHAINPTPEPKEERPRPVPVVPNAELAKPAEDAAEPAAETAEPAAEAAE